MNAARRALAFGLLLGGVLPFGVASCRGGEARARGEASGGAATARLPDVVPLADAATGPMALTTGQPVVVDAGQPVVAAAGLTGPTGLTQGPLAGGVPGAAPRALIHNPYAGDPAALRRGQYLYEHMNCAGCHGYKGEGGMGPNLADSYWRFGGDDADLFKTLWDGRPQGMPAWRNALTQDDIWRVIAYVRALGGTGTTSGAHDGGGHGTGVRTAAREQRESMPHVNVYLP